MGYYKFEMRYSWAKISFRMGDIVKIPNFSLKIDGLTEKTTREISFREDNINSNFSSIENDKIDLFLCDTKINAHKYLVSSCVIVYIHKEEKRNCIHRLSYFVTLQKSVFVQIRKKTRRTQ
jgi:hypothetical protein